MIKVLIVCGKLYIGGAEKVACDLGLYRDREKMDVDYLVFENDIGAYEPILEEAGCHIYHIDSPGESYTAYADNIRKLIRKNRYDVVHCHTMFNSGIVLSVAAKEKVPVRIAHSHSIRPAKNMGLKQETYQKLMRSLIHKNATDFVACGEAAGNWLFGEDFFDKHGTLVLNGIDTGKFRYNEEVRQSVRSELGLNHSFIVGHAGHLAGVKNQVYLIRLMPEILKTKENTVLLLLGEGPDRKMLENEVNKLGLKGKVFMPGNVLNVNEYLSAMDVFAFPSLYEGMPLSMIEVQSNGLPCIISDSVPKDVFLTDLLNSTSLEQPEEWIRKICNAQRIQPLVYNDIMHSSGFDISNMVKKVYSIYEKASVCH